MVAQLNHLIIPVKFQLDRMPATLITEAYWLSPLLHLTP